VWWVRSATLAYQSGMPWPASHDDQRGGGPPTMSSLSGGQQRVDALGAVLEVRRRQS